MNVKTIRNAKDEEMANLYRLLDHHNLLFRDLDKMSNKPNGYTGGIIRGEADDPTHIAFLRNAIRVKEEYAAKRESLWNESISMIEAFGKGKKADWQSIAQGEVEPLSKEIQDKSPKTLGTIQMNLEGIKVAEAVNALDKFTQELAVDLERISHDHAARIADHQARLNRLEGGTFTSNPNPALREPIVKTGREIKDEDFSRDILFAHERIEKLEAKLRELKARGLWARLFNR
jgi:hypothetical protein